MGGPRTPFPYPLSCHIQPDTPQLLHSSRFTSAADVVPIRYIAVPEDVTLPENCAKTESLAQ